MSLHDGRTTGDSWWEDNDRGLALAADADWNEAAEAFAAAADALARQLPTDASAHDPLAMVLGNLSQSLYRAGRADEAIQQAQRACALRVALAGEDGMPVARARTDLAVMLAAAGRLDEAMALVQRAIAGIEHRVGEEDARLATVLENGARIALAAGHPANAEPLLLRLHALLDVHELSTERADVLLARVAQVRAQQSRVRTQQPTPTMTPVSAVLAEVTRTVAEQEEREATRVALEAIDALAHADVEPLPPQSAPAAAAVETPAVYVHSAIEAEEDWEDQPLRDAVVLTDVLLRTTPSGVPAIPAPMDIDIVDDLEILPPAPAASAPDVTEEATPTTDSVLGFSVHHGIVDDTVDAIEPPLKAPPVSLPVPELPTAIEIVEPVSPIQRVDIVHASAVEAPPVQLLTDMVNTAPPVEVPTEQPKSAEIVAPAVAPLAWAPAMPNNRNTPRSMSVVLPTPGEGPRAISAEVPVISRGKKTSTAETRSDAKSAAKNASTANTSGSGKGLWIGVGGAALAAAGAAVWWFALR
ncbi:MAG: tetratricopeptide repeat protein [Gemmatimonadaceae bacterium]|nr:tetratricopeptide repeat protein [Gemmatimonadaceae bacterium]